MLRRVLRLLVILSSSFSLCLDWVELNFCHRQIKEASFCFSFHLASECLGHFWGTMNRARLYNSLQQMCPFESCHLLLWWQVKRRVKHRARWHLSKWKLVSRSLSFVATKIFETHFAELLALCFCLVHSCLGWEAQRACHTELVVQQ